VFSGTGRKGRGTHGLWLFWALALCLSASFLWSAFSGSRGILSLLQQRENARTIDHENRKLLEQNQALEKEIYLLRTDPSFLRKVAREELGYIAEGEKVYLPADIPIDVGASATPAQRPDPSTVGPDN